MVSVPAHRRNNAAIAVHKTHLRGWRTADLLRRYMEHQPFKEALRDFFQDHLDTLAMIAQLEPSGISLSLATGVKTYYDPDRSWCDLPSDRDGRLDLRCYSLNLRTLLDEWQLHRLSDDRGYFEVHAFCIGLYCDYARYSRSDRRLGAAGLNALPPVPIVGDVVGDASGFFGDNGEWVNNPVIRPRVRIDLTSDWFAISEPRAEAEKRLKKQFDRLLRQEMNRVLAQYEEKGFVVADTRVSQAREIDWFFRRFVLDEKVESIADSAFVSPGTVRNRTNSLATVIGFTTPRTRKRTS